jgi:DNA-binding IclR family transcriptional regulator
MRKRESFEGKFADLIRPEETDRQFIVALARGLEVLRCFEPGEGLLGNQELAEKTGLPKPTVSRITYTLSLLGYLQFVQRFSKYRLGPSVLSLGYAFLGNLHLRQIARPHMRELAHAFNGAVAMGARDRLSIVYLDLCRGAATLSLRLDVGSRLPIHGSAAGLTYIAALSGSEEKFILDALAASGEVDARKLAKSLKLAKTELDTQGFFVGCSLFEQGINTAACPLVAPDQGALHVFNISGPAYEFTAERLRENIGPRLQTMVQNIARDWTALGGALAH